MDALGQLRRLRAHDAWADAALLAALRAAPEACDAWREYAHVLGAESVWLARLERRPPSIPVWPTLSPAEAEALHRELHAGYAAYLDRLTPESLATPIAYVNSAGLSFETSIGDILLHVALHGQYHRGKVNLLLRQSGVTPVPADYVAFVRGTATAAATAGPALRR